MKKSLLLGFALLAVNANLFSQTVLFEDSFETYADFAITGVGSWTLRDVDLLPTYGIEQGSPAVSVIFANSGSPMAFMVMNSTAAVAPLDPAAWGGHTGVKCMAAMAGMPAGGVDSNNDYLISPQIQLGSTGNVLKFWAKEITTTYPELFKVGISTTGTAPSDFTFITTGTGVVPTTSWTEYTYNIDSYQGQNVYIAIQCVSSDAFALLIDDFKVTTTAVASADSFFANNFSMYPNPVANELNIVAKNNNTINAINIVDMNGRTVKNTNDAGMNNTAVNVSDLTSGVYFVTIETNEGTGTSKFIKK